MPRTTLSGTRIRAMRLARGMSQAELARLAGVSPSYLNLIEHNRRRAPETLLSAVAQALDIAPESLTDDAGDALLEALSTAAAMTGADPPPELDRIEEFAGRFPGWAAHLAALQGRSEAQDRIIERLSDRMTHDPNLSAALHEIVSAVTSVQSTAAILAETDDLDGEWLARFHHNIHADSRRLATAAEALVAYLDAASEETGLAAPQEELESWLARHGFHLPQVEDAKSDALAALRDEPPELASQASRALARDWLKRARADALALPLSRLEPALTAMLGAGGGLCPDQLAQDFGVSLSRLFRRLASLPPLAGVPRFGLVVCDGSGTLTYRRPVEGFALPRFGGACPVWPLYQALLQPGRPVRALVETASRPAHRFLAFAAAEPRGPERFVPPFAWESSMLLTPAIPQVMPPLGADAAAPMPLPVGSSCRVCFRSDCAARREPSILAS
ncbi:MAG: putative transcriptional regulator (DUF2083) [Rhodobacteraceae bacterium HLUCCA12]|nr:MAG: putative transcriptional regulator (DUF2083) [Rhodobacteraceae bacterium HLUCCA12]